MKPDVIEAIAASNAEQLEKAKDNAPSTIGMIGDTAVQLDSAGQIIEGVWFIAGHAASGIGMVAEGVGAILEAIPTLD